MNGLAGANVKNDYNRAAVYIHATNPVKRLVKVYVK